METNLEDRRVVLEVKKVVRGCENEPEVRKRIASVFPKCRIAQAKMINPRQWRILMWSGPYGDQYDVLCDI